MRSLVVTSLLLAVSVPALFGADVTGKWTGQSDQGPDFVFTLKADKDIVTGSMTGESKKEFPISEGKLNGNDISFVVNTEYQGNPIKLVVKGKLAQDSLQVHIATDDDSWSTDVTLKHAA